MTMTYQASDFAAWEKAGLLDYGDYAESVEFFNERESGFGDDEGEWYYADDATMTIYRGTHGNDHSPGSDHNTSAEVFFHLDAYRAALAELEAMPEELDVEADEAETVRCDSCQMVAINGIPCHETGCPEAWKGQEVACFECGCDFVPEVRGQRTCDDCLDPEPIDSDDDE